MMYHHKLYPRQIKFSEKKKTKGIAGISYPRGISDSAWSTTSRLPGSWEHLFCAYSWNIKVKVRCGPSVILFLK